MPNHKSKLRTDFVCIATSGYTVDGRQITAQELHEMAESYDPEYYTANLWPKHERWSNLGQVLELKAEEQDNGETKLYAVLSPNEDLIYANKRGKYLFSSIEIAPNFRNSGKNYLFGLGVTDTPASVGTTRLQFSDQNKTVETKNSDFIPLTFTFCDEPEDKLSRSFMSALRNFFIKQTAEEIPHNNNNKKDQSMDDKQFEQLIGAFDKLGEKIDGHFSAKTQPTETEEPKTEPTAPSATAETVTAEQFNQLLNAVTELDNKFNALSKETTPVPNGEPVNTDSGVQVEGYSFNFGK